MKKISLVLMLAVGIHVSAQTEFPDDLDSKMLNTLGRGPSENMDLSWVDEETRPIVIERLLRRLEEPDSIMPNRRYVEQRLVSINHVETIQRLIAEMHQTNSMNALCEAATEEALPYLFPELDIASAEIREPYTEGGELHMFVSNRRLFAKTILGIIASRAVFPDETRQWAKGMYRFMRNPQEEAQVEYLKLWWKNNKTAILEKRYADATWVPRYKGKPSDLGPLERNEREKDFKQEETDRKARRLTHGNPTQAPLVEVSSSERPWAKQIAVGVAVLLLGAAGLWKYSGIRARNK